ncbi:MAG: flagellar protein FlaG [Gammaproteobacteria bacterium]|nr:flagellar protein FlaG [Gammaproteobacteria bacterium]MDP2139331.1 flagellar protein FlaG [Gammaproteobacteria bacterium]MDP2346888.1 flagellar protein FlaG [Gammaproteobacteria bacterium]
MSEISITRFIHATAGPKKVKSLEKANNEGSNSGSFYSSSEDEESRHEDDVHDQSRHDEFPAEERVYEGDVLDDFSSLKAGVTEQSTATQTSERQLEAAVAKLNDYVQTVQRDIIFGITAGGAEPSVTVVDRASRKLVRQFGGKEAVEMAKKLDTQEPLSLFTAQV